MLLERKRNNYVWCLGLGGNGHYICWLNGAHFLWNNCFHFSMSQQLQVNKYCTGHSAYYSCLSLLPSLSHCHLCDHYWRQWLCLCRHCCCQCPCWHSYCPDNDSFIFSITCLYNWVWHVVDFGSGGVINDIDLMVVVSLGRWHLTIHSAYVCTQQSNICWGLRPILPPPPPKQAPLPSWFLQRNTWQAHEHHKCCKETNIE